MILKSMKRTKITNKASKGLAGALAIAGGTTAYGDIISVATPADFNVAPGTASVSVNWDVNGDSVVDFIFNYRYNNTATGSGVIWQANMNPFTGSAATNGTVGYQGAFIRYVTALPGGFSVGATLANSAGGGANNFSTATQATLGSRYLSAGVPSYYSGFASGPGGTHNAVAPGTPAFVGFRFVSGGQTLYGWIQLSVGAGSIDFISAAYQSTPGTAIAAGAIPEPSSLAMLALGAAGIAGLMVSKRRRA